MNSFEQINDKSMFGPSRGGTHNILQKKISSSNIFISALYGAYNILIIEKQLLMSVVYYACT